MRLIKTDDTWHNRIAWTFVKFKARMGRGIGWMEYVRFWFYADASVIGVDTVLKKFGSEIPLEWYGKLLVVLPLAAFVGAYLAAWIDEKWIQVWQREGIYQSDNLNPFFSNMNGNVTDTQHRVEQIEVTIKDLYRKVEQIELILNRKI